MKHTLSVLRRGQARRARADRDDVRAPRLQHRLARGRADRARRRVVHHAARRLRAPLAGADREADPQARQRAPRHRARARRGSRAGAAAAQGERDARPPGRADLDIRGVQGPRRRPRCRLGHVRADRHARRSSTPSRSSRGRTASRSSSAPGASAWHARPRRSRPAACRRSTDRTTTITRTPRRRDEQEWRRFSATAISACSTARLRSSATGARATPMRSTSGTRASRSRWACARARLPGERPRRPGSTVRTIADAVAGAQLVAMLLPDQVQPQVFTEHVEPNLAPGAAVLFAHGFNILYERIAPARRPRRDHGRPQGPGPCRAPPLHRGLRDAGADRRRAGRLRAAPVSSRSRTPSGSAPAAPGSSRRRSRRRPRPTCSASRPSSAAAPPSSSAPASRPSSRPGMRPRSPTTSASTS